jgi:hypothetical protein
MTTKMTNRPRQFDAMPIKQADNAERVHSAFEMIFEAIEKATRRVDSTRPVDESVDKSG